MKIIHTGDWHLGAKLYNYDRTDEELHFFRQLAKVVAEEQPDAMIVSGDVFHHGTPGNDVAKSFTDRLLEVQAKCPTMETVVIAGNHDSYSRLIVDKALWARCRVHVFGVPAEDSAGRALFEKNLVEVGDKGVIAAVPFCHPRNFPTVEGADIEDRARSYFDGLAKHVNAQAAGRPAVLVAHLAVKAELDLRGHDPAQLIGGEECVDEAQLGTAYNYIALGHIHCPQWIDSRRKLARYCGTPRAIHFDETYPHGVDIVTVEVGRPPEVRTVVFPPLHKLVTIGGDEGLPYETALREVAAAELPPDTYVRLNVKLEAEELPSPDWTERSRQACGAKGLRFCVNNPIRTEVATERQGARQVLTVAELKELSHDKVLEILSGRHELTDRHRELLKSLMEEVGA